MEYFPHLSSTEQISHWAYWILLWLWDNNRKWENDPDVMSRWFTISLLGFRDGDFRPQMFSEGGTWCLKVPGFNQAWRLELRICVKTTHNFHRFPVQFFNMVAIRINMFSHHKIYSIAVGSCPTDNVGQIDCHVNRKWEINAFPVFVWEPAQSPPNWSSFLLNSALQGTGDSRLVLRHRAAWTTHQLLNAAGGEDLWNAIFIPSI